MILSLLLLSLSSSLITISLSWNGLFSLSIWISFCNWSSLSFLSCFSFERISSFLIKSTFSSWIILSRSWMVPVCLSFSSLSVVKSSLSWALLSSRFIFCFNSFLISLWFNASAASIPMFRSFIFLLSAITSCILFRFAVSFTRRTLIVFSFFRISASSSLMISSFFFSSWSRSRSWNRSSFDCSRIEVIFSFSPSESWRRTLWSAKSFLYTSSCISLSSLRATLSASSSSIFFSKLVVSQLSAILELFLAIFSEKGRWLESFFMK